MHHIYAQQESKWVGGGGVLLCDPMFEGFLRPKEMVIEKPHGATSSCLPIELQNPACSDCCALISRQYHTFVSIREALQVRRSPRYQS